MRYRVFPHLPPSVRGLRACSRSSSRPLHAPHSRVSGLPSKSRIPRVRVGGATKNGATDPPSRHSRSFIFCKYRRGNFPTSGMTAARHRSAIRSPHRITATPRGEAARRPTRARVVHKCAHAQISRVLTADARRPRDISRKKIDTDVTALR